MKGSSGALLATSALRCSVLWVVAKAAGLSVTVGGWSPTVTATAGAGKDLTRGFTVALAVRDAPWAFCSGHPRKEPVARLSFWRQHWGACLLAPVALSEPGMAGGVTVTGFTGSLISAGVVTRGLQTSFPLYAMAMVWPALL